METRDREQLEALLLDLMSAQDSVTHYNVTNKPLLCEGARVERDYAKRRVIQFVERLEGTSNGGQTSTV